MLQRPVIADGAVRVARDWSANGPVVSSRHRLRLFSRALHGTIAHGYRNDPPAPPISNRPHPGSRIPTPASRAAFSPAPSRTLSQPQNLIKLNEPLANDLGLDPVLPARRCRCRHAGRQQLSRKLVAHCHGLCRPPVRPFCAATRRWPRHPAGRGDRPQWRAPRHPAQGRRPNAVFARRRRPCRARASASRVYRQRGMAALGIPTTRALAAVLTGDTVLPGGHTARCGPDPCRGEPYPRRDLPVLRRARRLAGGARSRRPCRSPGTIRRRRCRRDALSGASGSRHRRSGRSRRSMARCRLHPRGHEHRQHVDCRGDHRLWSLRLHGRLSP